MFLEHTLEYMMDKLELNFVDTTFLKIRITSALEILLVNLTELEPTLGFSKVEGTIRKIVKPSETWCQSFKK